MGLCKIVDGKIKECDVEIEGGDELTKEQQGKVDELLANIVAVGELIQQEGDDGLKEAWDDIGAIFINPDSSDSSNNSEDNVSLNKDSFSSLNQQVSRTDHQRFVITHEIVHSKAIRKSAMKAAILEQGKYDPSVLGSPTRIQEQRM